MSSKQRWLGYTFGWFCLCAAFWAFASNAAAASAPEELAQAASPAVLQRFALIVGVNDGGSGREPLRYADSDARAMAGVLGQLGGVRAADFILLQESSSAALLQALERLGTMIQAVRQPGRRIELLFYYSGHSDEQGLLLGNARLSYAVLRTAIAHAAADVTIAILDSCSAGAFTRLKGGVQRPPFLLDTSVQVRGHAFLASSSENEAAQESDRIGSSFFTHYLISGLRGAADISGDGRVTLNEAYNFAFQETLARTEKTLSGAQHPAYDIELAGTGDVVLTDLRDPQARIVFPQELQGRIYVRLASGTLAAELTKHGGAEVTLALEPGQYQIILERENRLYQADIAAIAGKSVALHAAMLTLVSAEPTKRRGGMDQSASGAAQPAIWVPVNLSLIPSLSINRLFQKPSHLIVNAFSFHLLAGLAGTLRGLEIGLAANWRTQDAFGIQLAGALNVAGRSQVGMQLTMGVNVVGQNALGLQFAGVANFVSRNAVGISISSGLNLIGGRGYGFHLSGFDIVRGHFAGAQLAGIAAFTGGTMSGMQISSGIAQAGQVYGVQVAFINIGGEVHGAQLGFINIAETVHGAQLGFINIARTVHGAAIGLLSFIQNGTHTLEIYGSDLVPFHLGAKLGGSRAYGIIDVGIDPFHELIRWSYGAGLGTHISLLRGFFLDVDLMVHSLQPDIRTFDVALYHVQTELRLLVGWQLLPRLAIFLGPTVHVSASNDPCCMGAVSQFGGAERLFQSGETAIRLGPGLAVGIRAF